MTVTTETQPLTDDTTGPLALVATMDDGKVNALSFDMLAALNAAIDEAEANDDIRAMVLTGRDGKFSAGFDLGVMNSGDMSAIVNLVADGGDLVRRLYGCSVPVIAASTGHALAAGALMLMGCDVRVSVDGPFKVGLNEVAIGMTLPQWAHTIAEQRLSKRHIQRAIANARLTDPATAVDVGFLDRTVAADALHSTALEEAAEMVALDAAAYERTMEGFRKPTLDQMAADIAADRATA